jgi:putative transposase
VKIPVEVLISDITYIKINQNFVFLCAVMDLASRKIVGWSLMNHMETNLITTALERSYKMNKPNKNCIFHSDRGSQYASIEFRNLLSKHKVIQSMSRKGNCYDNACMESFFNTIKKELINKKEYSNKEELKNDLFEYIDVYYNNKRIHSSLGYLTPREYELNYLQNK